MAADSLQTVPRELASGLTLREVGADQAPLVLELTLSAFEEYRTLLDPPSGVHRLTVNAIRDKLQTAHWVVAFLDSTPVGSVMYEEQEDALYFGRLAVLPAYRRRGIARTLIEHVEALARARGYGRVRLGVRLGLPHLRALYERLGYRPVEYHTHPGYAEPTFISMDKDLA